jgi:hypothetical protein
MEIIRDSNVSELAHQFWERQARKTQNGKDVLAKIEAGEDAYRLLKGKAPVQAAHRSKQSCEGRFS